MADKLNFIFMHSHNTGTFIEPYGHPVPTPHLQRLAREGILFRHAFAAGPTCSPSRASFLSGMHHHCTGLLGLSHRGFSMDTKYHVVQILKQHGYYTMLSGVEHTTPDASKNGYDEVIHASGWLADAVKDDPAASVVEFLGRDHDKPFFISMGLQDTHTPFKEADPENHPAEDWRYCHTFPHLPDCEMARREVAKYKASARAMDEAYGRVLQAIDENGLRENTVVFCFSDHGLQIPHHICNVTDRGLGVYLIVRGPGALQGGKVVHSLVSLIDLVPTVYHLAGIEIPPFVQGRSLLPLLRGETETHRDHIIGSLNFHAAYEPMRCVRTERYLYVRRYDGRDKPVLPNCDDSPLKDYLLENGWLEQTRDQEELYDLVFDPDICRNRINDPLLVDELTRLRQTLDAWQAETQDPILPDGVIPPPRGSRSNDVDGRSPREKPIQY